MTNCKCQQKAVNYSAIATNAGLTLQSNNIRLNTDTTLSPTEDMLDSEGERNEQKMMMRVRFYAYGFPYIPQGSSNIIA